MQVMSIRDTYVVTVLLDVNPEQDIDDRAESRTYTIADRESPDKLSLSIPSSKMWTAISPSPVSFP